MQSYLTSFLDNLLPDLCVLCDQPLVPRYPHLLCCACWDSLTRIHTGCPTCALPLTTATRCGTCLNNPVATGIAVIPLIYDDTSRYLVHRLKFHHGLREGRTLAVTMHDAITLAYEQDDLPQCVIATPLSWRSQVRRGYNQAMVLSSYLSKRLGIAAYHPVRRKHGVSQRTLSRRQRTRISHQVFQVRNTLEPYQHVAIVDDVLTTGGTARALATALSNQGVARVDVWCATRAVLE